VTGAEINFFKKPPRGVGAAQAASRTTVLDFALCLEDNNKAPERTGSQSWKKERAAAETFAAWAQ
jgi:hypothetical protein